MQVVATSGAPVWQVGQEKTNNWRMGIIGLAFVLLLEIAINIDFGSSIAIHGGSAVLTVLYECHAPGKAWSKA